MRLYHLPGPHTVCKRTVSLHFRPEVRLDLETHLAFGNNAGKYSACQLKSTVAGCRLEVTMREVLPPTFNPISVLEQILV